MPVLTESMPPMETPVSASAELKAVVLAAGRQAVSDDGRLLVLARPGDSTVLACVLENAAQIATPENIWIVVGYRENEVRAEAGPAYNYVTQHEPLGTGHAVLQACEALANFHGNLLILYGDTPLFRPASIRGLLNRHRSAAGPSDAAHRGCSITRCPTGASSATPAARSSTLSKTPRPRPKCARFAS